MSTKDEIEKLHPDFLKSFLKDELEKYLSFSYPFTDLNAFIDVDVDDEKKRTLYGVKFSLSNTPKYGISHTITNLQLGDKNCRFELYKKISDEIKVVRKYKLLSSKIHNAYMKNIQKEHILGSTYALFLDSANFDVLRRYHGRYHYYDYRNLEEPSDCFRFDNFEVYQVLTSKEVIAIGDKI